MRLISSEQEFLLRRGRVPAPRIRNIRRDDVMERLYANVCGLVDDKAQWLGVYGMVGCGKSQLVVDLLWEKPELILAHFKRVFWLTDRNLNVDRVTDVANDALVLLSNSSGIDDSFEQVKDSTSATRSFLSNRIHSKLSEFKSTAKILFIVDGVMNVETIRFFDECRTRNCYFIATSTSREVFSVLERCSLFHVEGGNDFSVNDWAKMAHSFDVEIPSAILKNLIVATGRNFALMEKIFQLVRGDFKMIPSILHRVRFRPLREISCTTAYHHTNIEEPLQLCFKMINDSLSSAFERCAPFEPLKPISFELLHQIWPLDLCGQETHEEIHGMIKQDLRLLTWNSLLEIEGDERDHEMEFNNSSIFDVKSSSFDESGSSNTTRFNVNFPMDKYNQAEYCTSKSLCNYAKIKRQPMPKKVDSGYYWIHPIVSSYIIHGRPNNYKKFHTCVTDFISDLRSKCDNVSSHNFHTAENSSNAIFVKYYTENSERLQRLEKWSSILCEKQLQNGTWLHTTLEHEQNIDSSRAINSLQFFINLILFFIPTKMLRSLYNFFQQFVNLS